MKRLIYIYFSLLITFSLSAQTTQNTARMSIAMLNYMARECINIEMSRENRLVLDETRRRIVNNTNPSVVDLTTQGYLNSLLQSLTSMSLTTIQRDRIQLIYENEKAQALSQSLPNPLFLLSMRNTDPLQLIANVALMTVDSFVRYGSAKEKANFNFLLSNLDLEKEDITNLAKLTDDYFNYMIDISRQYKLADDGSETLNEVSIKNFITNGIKEENLDRRLQWLDNNRKLYSNYGLYWLRLAETCFDLGFYERCISSVQQYESIKLPIFRKDYDFTAVIPFVILSASKLYGNNLTYQRMAAQYLEKLVSNIIESDWALRYFAAQAYISLAGLSNKEQNLNSAYNLLVINLVYLSREQEKLTNQYLNPIVDDSKLPKRQRNEDKNINRELRKQRDSELPPLHSGFALHYQVIFPLMKEMNISSVQRNRVNNILRNTYILPKYKNIYLGEELNYSSKSFSISKESTSLWSFPKLFIRSLTGVWDVISLKLPASFITSETKINISITNGDKILYNRIDSYYYVENVTRSRDQNLNNFIVKLLIAFYEDDDVAAEESQSIEITKNKEFKLTITLDTHGVQNNLYFSSPIGRTNFVFDKMD